MGMSYLDVRVCFVWLNVLYNFHLIAIPLFDRHTGNNQFQVLTKFLDALLAANGSIPVSVNLQMVLEI